MYFNGQVLVEHILLAQRYARPCKSGSEWVLSEGCPTRGPAWLWRWPNTKSQIYLKSFFCSSIFISVCVFDVWLKSTLLLPVWPSDTKRLDTPASLTSYFVHLNIHWMIESFTFFLTTLKHKINAKYILKYFTININQQRSQKVEPKWKLSCNSYWIYGH